jgi:hypothetical protein
MESPTVSRRQFFLLMLAVLASATVCWVQYELDWIRERREYLVTEGVFDLSECYGGVAADRPLAPRLLWLFRENGVKRLAVMETSRADFSRAKSLFPEAQREQAAFISGAVYAR